MSPRILPRWNEPPSRVHATVVEPIYRLARTSGENESLNILGEEAITSS